MSTHADTPKASRTAGSKIFRYAGAVLAVLLAAFLVDASINVVADYSLVKEAFPSLPAQLTTDMNLAILFSPAMLVVDRSENRFLHWIKDPNLTLPDMTAPVRNTIGDEIHKAQTEQNLVRLNEVLPLDNTILITQSSIAAVGRAIYLSQERPAARRFEQGKAASIGDRATERQAEIKQLRQIFEIAYGEKALQQVTRPEK
jgi:hypothetical protein